MEKKTRNLLIGLGVFVALIAIVLIIFNLYKPQSQPAPAAETETSETEESVNTDEQSEEAEIEEDQAADDQTSDDAADDAAAEGSKNIIIEVKDSEGNVTTYEVTTDAEFLRQAMDEAEGLTYEGTDSEYGMMVEVVNGEQAIYAEDNAYWAFYVNGEYGNYGIDSQPVTDGDTYSIVYEAAN
jgi:cytoskeletal protein RodZ